jgi:inorganic pyrophosphatase
MLNQRKKYAIYWAITVVAGAAVGMIGFFASNNTGTEDAVREHGAVASKFLSAPMPMLRASTQYNTMKKRASRFIQMRGGYSTVAEGETGTEAFRLRFNDGKGDISPWHDIPLKTSTPGVFNAVFEIPKMTKPKMEVATKEEKNPIAQDVKKGKLRDYHGPIFWNYGMFPQTWEDPNVVNPETKSAGDDDPVDVVEIGSEAIPMGTVAEVKVLGILAMIDDGELDWKVIAIQTGDKLASELNDIQDVETKCPGTISGIREWFRWYKTPDGKPINEFGFDEKALDKAKALEVLAETNEAWEKLIKGETDKGKIWLPA